MIFCDWLAFLGPSTGASTGDEGGSIIPIVAGVIAGLLLGLIIGIAVYCFKKKKGSKVANEDKKSKIF